MGAQCCSEVYTKDAGKVIPVLSLKVPLGVLGSSDGVVASTEDEITIRPRTAEEIAEAHADVIFSKLKGDLTDDILKELETEVMAVALSKEKCKFILQKTEDVRLSCNQMLDLTKMLALENWKEQVMMKRYAHLTDRDQFRASVINPFTRSDSMRENLMRKLIKQLNEEADASTRMPDVVGQ